MYTYLLFLEFLYITSLEDSVTYCNNKYCYCAYYNTFLEYVRGL